MKAVCCAFLLFAVGCILLSCDSEGDRRAKVKNQIDQIDSRLGSLKNEERESKCQAAGGIFKATAGGAVVGAGAALKSREATGAGVGLAADGVKQASQAGQRLDAVRNEQRSLESQKAALSEQLK